ncbi:hypothetical protein PAPYR_759 [Paratrimastix pyriformis]|uniref:Uncharacterized protein n=1 Tax=Paratrimastix pyriformis TaxID=342808 RepID=A0ABQ8UVY8_9EUKA|nr:hypothetical protein PAPYR_759 [Paratrimastix pyriformis]
MSTGSEDSIVDSSSPSPPPQPSRQSSSLAPPLPLPPQSRRPSPSVATTPRVHSPVSLITLRLKGPGAFPGRSFQVPPQIKFIQIHATVMCRGPSPYQNYFRLPSVSQSGLQTSSHFFATVPNFRAPAAPSFPPLQLRVAVAAECSVEQTIGCILEQYRAEQFEPPLEIFPEMYSLFVVDEHGDIDEDLPELDLAQPFKQFGRRFALCFANPPRRPRLLEMALMSQRQPRSRVQPVMYRIELPLPSGPPGPLAAQQSLRQGAMSPPSSADGQADGSVAPPVPHLNMWVSPDILASELLGMVCARQGLSLSRCTLRPADNPAMPLDIRLTLHRLGLTHFRLQPLDQPLSPPVMAHGGLMGTLEGIPSAAPPAEAGDSSNAWGAAQPANTNPGMGVGAGSATSQGPAPQQDLATLSHNFVFSEVTASQYKEYTVIKINKYGLRQERVLGLDCDKVYNIVAKHSGLFNLKRPKRAWHFVDDLQGIEEGPGPVQFVLEFLSQGDTTRYRYEAASPVERAEIVARLRFLMNNKKRV